MQGPGWPRPTGPPSAQETNSQLGAGDLWRDTPGPTGVPCPQLREVQVPQSSATKLVSSPWVPCPWVAASGRRSPAGREEPQGDQAAGLLLLSPGPPGAFWGALPRPFPGSLLYHTPSGTQGGPGGTGAAPQPGWAGPGHRCGGGAHPVLLPTGRQASGRWGRGAGRQKPCSRHWPGIRPAPLTSLRALPGLRGASARPGAHLPGRPQHPQAGGVLCRSVPQPWAQ